MGFPVGPRCIGGHNCTFPFRFFPGVLHARHCLFAAVLRPRTERRECVTAVGWGQEDQDETEMRTSPKMEYLFVYGKVNVM